MANTTKADQTRKSDDQAKKLQSEPRSYEAAKVTKKKRVSSSSSAFAEFEKRTRLLENSVPFPKPGTEMLLPGQLRGSGFCSDEVDKQVDDDEEEEEDDDDDDDDDDECENEVAEEVGELKRKVSQLERQVKTLREEISPHGQEDFGGLHGFVNPLDFIKLMLQSYLEKEGISPEQQALILSGKDLEDGRALKVSCASRESGLHLDVSLKHRKVHLINVKTFTGKTVVIIMKPTATIYDLKKKIQDKEGIPPDKQRLVCAGRQLDDDKTVEDYGIVSGSLIHLVLHLQGG